MRSAILFLLFFVCLGYLDGMARAQNEVGAIRVLPNGQVISVGTPAGTPAKNQAAGLPTGQDEIMRPPDNSDPEMQMLWNEITHTPSCNTVLVLCEPRLGKVKGGGDRLAKYLISQYELAEIRKKGTGDSYLRFVGATGERGVSYLLEKASRPETMQIGLEGLLFAADVRAIDKAVWVLSKEDFNLPGVLAVGVVRLNMITSGTIRESDLALLRRLEQDEKRGLRGWASRALKDLEARGLITPDEKYPHPEDLKMWVPNPIEYQ